MDSVVINRGKVIDNLESLPPYSIALDGFFPGPALDSDHHRFSFDHHAGCLRFATQATCMQALLAVQLGLQDIEKYTIYCNDVDIDVCAAVWILKNPDCCRESLVIKLINAIGLGDAYLGAIPLNGMHKVIEWICDPETSSKRHQDYNKISDEGLRSILEAVCYRIDSYVNGESALEISRQPKHETDYRILRNESDWVLVESSDPHCCGQLFQAGFDRIVLLRPQSNGSQVVTLARKSAFIDNFPLHKFYQELNLLEPGWGGSDQCGGSPRHHDGVGSKLTLDQITQTIDRVIRSDRSVP